MLTLPEPMRAMASYAQFIVWEAVWNATKNKFEKYPVNPHTLKRFPKADKESDWQWQNDPTYWTTFEHAAQSAALAGMGVGFLFTKHDPFFFVDIDGALTEDGSWSPFACELALAFQGCAVEISQSGKGLHIFGMGSAPVGHRCRDDKLGLEFYTEGRFVALTGTSAIGDAATVKQDGIDFLLAKYLPPRAFSGSQEWTSEPVEDWSGPVDDDELIKKMLSAKNSAAAAFGTRAPLTTLWAGDEEELSKFFPSTSGDAFDRSAADAALCQHLAFWAGKDCDRVQRLFERSGLVRDKWRDREDYRQETIIKGCNWCSSVYQDKKKIDKTVVEYESVTPFEVPEGTLREGYQYRDPTQQLAHFKDCVYVSRVHAVKVPNGDLLKADPFRVMYGGYWFAMDSIGDKTTKSAWEVFTESQAIRFPRADTTCFRPELAVNAIIEEGGRTMVNTYVPIVVKRVRGDVSIFLDHLYRLVPDARDREILLSYMAACAQMVGVKFRWCPFIQGVPGNGKTTISEILEAAIGSRYTHTPSSQDLANKFNGWLDGKLFVYVNDVYTADRQEVIEFLKPMITDRRAEIQPKGGEKYMADNRANFILNSNHKDGIRKTLEDRRLAPFFTPQQTRDDLIVSGMTTAYFSKLSNWLNNEDGYAMCAEYLSTYNIKDEYNPALMSEAPITTSTPDAIQAGLGGIEQEIVEAIEQGRPGFQGGWISSGALDRLIEQRKDQRRMPPNKRKDMLASLGYELHPNLTGGRAGTIVAIDGGIKPRLYVKRGSLQSLLRGNAAIVDAYVKAQEVGGVEAATEVFKRV